MTEQAYEMQSVSIPSDLKVRINEIGGQVNWSAVATVAFRKKVAEIDAAEKDEEFRGVIDRLKLIIAKEQANASPESFWAGHDWAMHVATPRELESAKKYGTLPASVLQSLAGPKEQEAFVHGAMLVWLQVEYAVMR